MRIEGKGERKYERNYLHVRRTLDVSLCTLDVSLTVDTSVVSQKWHFVMVFETFSDFSVLAYTRVLSDLSMNIVNVTKYSEMIFLIH